MDKALIDTQAFSHQHKESGSLTCETIVRSAAFATGCGFGVFLRGAWNKLEIAAEFGGSLFTKMPLDEVLARHLAELHAGQLLIVSDFASLQSQIGSECFDAIAASDIRFLAAAPILDTDGHTLGALLVAGSGHFGGLSKAQQYVLRAHAAQLGATIELGVFSTK